MGPKLKRLAVLAGALLIAAHVAHGELGFGGHALDRLFDDGVYDAVIVGGAISCLARGLLVREERLPWLILGAGLGFDALGEIYYSVAFGENGNPPIPSVADALYLLYYPCAYVGLVLLGRTRLERLNASTWLDGAIAATTSAAVVAAIAFEPILRSATHGSAPAIATNLAYPLGDLILLAIVCGVFALAGWRPGRAWLLLGVGLAIGAIADISYTYENANGAYSVGGILDSLWMASAMATGAAAWQPVRRSRPRTVEAKRLLLLPGVFALIALGVLLYGGFHHVGAVGLILAAAGLVTVILRAGWTFRENVKLLESSQHEAITDALTGLGNRRAMTAALDRALRDGPDSEPAILVMFDLDGFKLYNDHFGHLAGDTLLAHLGGRLQNSVRGSGSAYRLGGDEFCVLLDADLEHADVQLAAALAALTALGEGFNVTSSHGTVALPRETHSPTSAMRIADDRMYAQKHGRAGSAREQTHDVLLGLLRERQPELHLHLHEVGRLALVVGRRFGMNEEQLDELRRAAELHDIGKAAIPDAVLNKPGPLTEHEWTFMRRHTLVGERILAAAPALAPVAPLVRSSHERWDGAGYPDRLRGEQIPLGARIVAVCDAFDAMTSERPYSEPKTPSAAIAELQRVSGTQFDPDVVDAFVFAWREAAQVAAPSRAPSYSAS